MRLNATEIKIIIQGAKRFSVRESCQRCPGAGYLEQDGKAPDNRTCRGLELYQGTAQFGIARLSDDGQ